MSENKERRVCAIVARVTRVNVVLPTTDISGRTREDRAWIAQELTEGWGVSIDHEEIRRWRMVSDVLDSLDLALAELRHAA
jgi:hypothetical protein